MTCQLVQVMEPAATAALAAHIMNERMNDVFINVW